MTDRFTVEIIISEFSGNKNHGTVGQRCLMRVIEAVSSVVECYQLIE